MNRRSRRATWSMPLDIRTTLDGHPHSYAPNLESRSGPALPPLSKWLIRPSRASVIDAWAATL
eukprot:4638818-Pyramimonas_sp.AAC.1